MKGAHQAAIKKAKVELLEAAQKFTECQAFAYRELLRISIKRLEETVDREMFPLYNQCPYCGQPTKYAPSPTSEWTCDCFEEVENP